MNIKKIRILKIILISIVFILLCGCTNKNDNVGLIYGNKDAKVEIVNYTSFQCSACITFHEDFGEIIEKYIDSGDIKYIEKQIDIARFEYDDLIYKHMNQEQISDFSKLSEIYEKQDEWIKLETPKEVIELLDLEKEENKKHIKDIEKINEEKLELKLKSVPTMFINGENIPTNITKEEFENRIEELLK